MKRTLLLSFCALLGIKTNLMADFFAFRKLVNPETKNVVYLLYDIHASTTDNPLLEKQLLGGMDDIITNAIKQDKRGNNFVDKYKNIQNTFKSIDLQANLLRNNLPNLVKQHNDLTAIVKKYQISLINEDWGDPQQAQMFFPIGAGAHKFQTYIESIVGHQKQYKDKLYQIGVSPLFGISKTLIGKFTALEFKPIENAYFYNADARNGLFCFMPKADGSKEVEENTLNAIDLLFTQYHQNAVIISEGYQHITAIADTLIKEGYLAGDLVIHPNLAQQRTGPVDIFLNALEKNYFIELKKAEKENNFEELTYKLIETPLDINALFEKELS